MLHTKNQLPRLPRTKLRSSSIWKKLRSSSIFKNIEVVLHNSSSWVKIRLHTENQLNGLPGSALKVSVVEGWGGFHSIMWSPQLRFRLELGCDNIFSENPHSPHSFFLKQFLFFYWTSVDLFENVNFANIWLEIADKIISQTWSTIKIPLERSDNMLRPWLS